MNGSKIPEEVLYGNEALAALAGVSNVVPGELYWTMKDTGETGHVFPTDLPAGGNVRAFSLDPTMMLRASVDEAYTNLHKSYEIPQNFKGFLINGMSVDHWGFMADGSLMYQQFLHEARLHAAATLRINEKAIIKRCISNVQTACGIKGFAFDRAAAADIALAHLNDGEPGRISKWESDEVIFIPKSKSFDVLLHYVVANMTACTGMAWAVRVTLWGKAILQVD